MALGIGSTSTSSLFAQNALRINNLLFSRTSAQLSSGRRLVSGAIDPSGLAISQGFRAQMGGTDQAIYNAQDTINLTRTADAALDTQGDILGRMRDLSVRAGNEATMTQADRDRLNTEFQSLSDELTRQGQSNTFNTKNLTTDVAGEEYGTQQTQVGPNSGPENQIDVTINPSTADTLGTTDTVANQDISTTAGAQDAIDIIDEAIAEVSTQRANLGITERRLQSTVNTLSTSRINLAAANSRIADTDFASTISEMTRGLLLSRISMSALSQSNAQGFGVLKLLGAG